jgi:alanine dehydrogenase
VLDGVVHYGVDNIPGAAPHTASKAYAAAVLPHIRSIANNGVAEACRRDGFLRRSLTVYKGILTHEETCVVQGREFTFPEEALGLTDRNDLDFVPKATTTKLPMKMS